MYLDSRFGLELDSGSRIFEVDDLPGSKITGRSRSALHRDRDLETDDCRMNAWMMKRLRRSATLGDPASSSFNRASRSILEDLTKKIPRRKPGKIGRPPIQHIGGLAYHPPGHPRRNRTVARAKDTRVSRDIRHRCPLRGSYIDHRSISITMQDIEDNYRDSIAIQARGSGGPRRKSVKKVEPLLVLDQGSASRTARLSTRLSILGWNRRDRRVPESRPRFLEDAVK
ncbi:hypothetical protein KM043_014636 [Ampulex compressa]|nr:hypothetical protein KM043_014636 [Ampulex compressa]